MIFLFVHLNIATDWIKQTQKHVEIVSAHIFFITNYFLLLSQSLRVCSLKYHFKIVSRHEWNTLESNQIEMQRNNLKLGGIGEKKNNRTVCEMGSSFHSSFKFWKFSKCQLFASHSPLGKSLKCVKEQENTSKMKPRKLSFLGVLSYAFPILGC